MLRSKLISYLNLNCNKIRVADFERLLNLSMKSCEEVAEVMRAAVKAKIAANINSFYLK